MEKGRQCVKASAPTYTTRHWSVFCPTVGSVSIFKLTPRFQHGVTAVTANILNKAIQTSR